MPLVTAVIVLVFGGLTLVLQDETFIKLKPTIIYVLFGGVLLGGLAFRKPLLGMVFDSVFHLTDEGWRKLTLRWALFFFALAVLNEIVWRTQSTDFWVSFKVFGVLPLTFLFARAAVSAADEVCRAGRRGEASSEWRIAHGERPCRYSLLAASAFSIAGFSAVSRFSGVIGPISL